MPQTSYSLNQGVSFAGMKADSRFDTVESFIAEGIIPFGRALGAEAGNVLSVHNVTKDVCALLFDADFVTGNIITITVNGVASAAETFATDHDTTVDNVKAAIEAIAGVSSVTLTDVTNNREFTIETEGVVITVSETVTAGGSQATGGMTYSSDDIFRGISLHTHKEDGQYIADDAVNCLRKGMAWVETGVAVTADEVAYVDVAGGIGKFTNVSSANLATGGKFRSTVAAAGLALLEINL